jgi:hypothetical protein
MNTPPKLPAKLKGHWRAAKVRMGLLLFALGVPLPLVLLFVLLRGCVS